MDSFDDLPRLIQTARKALGLTQADLAAKAHVSRVTIFQLESGIVPDLGFRKLAVIMQAVGLELAVRPISLPMTLNQLNELNAIEHDHALREADALVAASMNASESGQLTSRRGRR